MLVIGGGHAGAEAAWAAARLGAMVALVTFRRDAIGRMSCNPAIGGIGKGQIVREIDALGGLMGLVADQTGIQFRMLNRRKGPAVWAPRCQSDRELYAAAVQRQLSSCAGLTVIEGAVESIDVEPDAGGRSRVTGVTLAGGEVFATRTVVVVYSTILTLSFRSRVPGPTNVSASVSITLLPPGSTVSVPPFCRSSPAKS